LRALNRLHITVNSNFSSYKGSETSVTLTRDETNSHKFPGGKVGKIDIVELLCEGVDKIEPT
jgi:hypothetical protein